MDELNLVIHLVEVCGANIDIRDNINGSAWEYLLLLWQDIEWGRRGREILTRILIVFLPRSIPPQHVETALLATKYFRDLVKRGHDLVARRQGSALLN
jgi:hypothetical protein